MSEHEFKPGEIALIAFDSEPVEILTWPIWNDLGGFSRYTGEPIDPCWCYWVRRMRDGVTGYAKPADLRVLPASWHYIAELIGTDIRYKVIR